MKKYKPQRFGLNPEWVRQRITIPVCKITLIALLIVFVFYQFKNYCQFKEQERLEQKEIEESINVEESIIAESKRAKEQMTREEEAKKQSIAQIELEKQRTNTLWEDKITKNVIDGKKYWRNNETMKVGKVERIYGLEVVTNNEWSFTLDTNGNIPEEIVNIGYHEYIKNLNKQKEIAQKKYQKENADRLQKIVDNEIAELTKQTKSKLSTNYIRLDKELYRIWEVKGDQLFCTKKGQKKKKSNYIQITYSDLIECVSYVEYEVG